MRDTSPLHATRPNPAGSRIRLLMVPLLLVVLLLGGLLPAPVEADTPISRELFFLLDNSASMRGSCKKTCQTCSSDADCARFPEGVCDKEEGRCLTSKKCEDIWDPVVAQLQSYLASVPENGLVHLYTFNQKGEAAKRLTTEEDIPRLAKRHVLDLLQGMEPNAQCTHLYDITDQVLDRMESARNRFDLEQHLWIFTDGEDDGSKTVSGKQLRDRLERDGKQGSYSYRIIRPVGQLKPVCDGNPNCSEYAADPSLGRRSWILEPGFQWSTPNPMFALSVPALEANLSLSFSDKTITPFRVTATFVAADPVTEKFLTVQEIPPFTDLTPSQVVSFHFKPDLAQPRPERLRGNIRLRMVEGHGKLTSTEIPIDLPVAVVSTTPPGDDATLQVFDNLQGMQLEYPLPDPLVNLLRPQVGHTSLSWRATPREIAEELRTLDPKQWDLRILDGSFPVSSGLRLELNLPSYPFSDEQGQIQVDFADTNGWFRLEGVSFYVTLSPRPDHASVSDNSLWWALGGFLLIFVIAAPLALNVNGHPDFSGLSLIVSDEKTGTIAEALLPNRPLRFGSPKRRVRLAYTPAGASGSTEQLPVTLEWIKARGGIMLSADKAVFRALNAGDHDEPLERYLLCQWEGGQIHFHDPMQVGNNGPILRVAAKKGAGPE